MCGSSWRQIKLPLVQTQIMKHLHAEHAGGETEAKQDFQKESAAWGSNAMGSGKVGTLFC